MFVIKVVRKSIDLPTWSSTSGKIYGKRQIESLLAESARLSQGQQLSEGSLSWQQHSCPVHPLIEIETDFYIVVAVIRTNMFEN